MDRGRITPPRPPVLHPLSGERRVSRIRHDPMPSLQRHIRNERPLVTTPPLPKPNVLSTPQDRSNVHTTRPTFLGPAAIAIHLSRFPRNARISTFDRGNSNLHRRRHPYNDYVRVEEYRSSGLSPDGRKRNGIHGPLDRCRRFPDRIRDALQQTAPSSDPTPLPAGPTRAFVFPRDMPPDRMASLWFAPMGNLQHLVDDSCLFPIQMGRLHTSRAETSFGEIRDSAPQSSDIASKPGLRLAVGPGSVRFPD